MDRRVLITGLPSSGKSTYVGLLFAAIEAGIGQLRLDGFRGDVEYVNELTDRLARCDEAVRTDVNRADGFRADLLDASETSFHLDLPDYSGETWKTALEAHGWPDVIERDVRDSSGLCLFVKVGDVVNDGSIIDANRLTRSLQGDVLPDSPAPTHPASAKLTTQIALVELLQVLSSRRLSGVCRVSVVISAFDLVSTLSPTQWLRTNLPLLDQYLRSGRPEIEAEVFGVSAQGGRFDLDSSKSDLLTRTILDRAFVKDSAGRDAPVESPILWAAGIERDVA